MIGPAASGTDPAPLSLPQQGPCAWDSTGFRFAHSSRVPRIRAVPVQPAVRFRASDSGMWMVESVADTTMTQRFDESAWPGQPPSRGEGAGTDASRAEPGRRSCLSDPARGARQGTTASDKGYGLADARVLRTLYRSLASGATRLRNTASVN